MSAGPCASLADVDNRLASFAQNRMQDPTRLALVQQRMLSSSPSGIGGKGGATSQRVPPLSAQISAAVSGSASVGVIIHPGTQESGRRRTNC